MAESTTKGLNDVEKESNVAPTKKNRRKSYDDEIIYRSLNDTSIRGVIDIFSTTTTTTSGSTITTTSGSALTPTPAPAPTPAPSPAPAPAPATVPEPVGEIERMVFNDVVIEPFKLEDIKSEEHGIVVKSIEYPKVIIEYIDIELPIDPNSIIEGITINDAPFTIEEKNIVGSGKPDVINDVVFPPQKIYGPEIQLKDSEGKTIPVKLEYLEYPSVVVSTVNLPDPAPADLSLQPITIKEEKKVSGLILDKPQIETNEEMETKSGYQVNNLQLKDLPIPPEITFFPWDYGVESHPEVTIGLKDAPFTLNINSVIVRENPILEKNIDNIRTSPIVIDTIKTENPNNSEMVKLIPSQTMQIKLENVNIDLEKNIKTSLKNKKRIVPKLKVKDVTIPVIVNSVEVPKENFEKINRQIEKKKQEQSTQNKKQVNGDTSEPTAEEKNSVDAVKGKITDKQREVIKKSLGFRESGNNYKAKNRYGFVGKFQFGAAALNDLGMVKRNVKTNGALSDSNNWTGKYGITSLEQFLNSPEIQEKVAEDWINLLEKRLRSQKIIDDSTSSSDVAGYIATSHLLGTGGAKKLKQGIVGKDANGTSAVEYFNIGKKAGYNQQYVSKNKFINLNKSSKPAPTPTPTSVQETNDADQKTSATETKRAKIDLKKPITISSSNPIIVESKPVVDSEKKKIENQISRQKAAQKTAEKSQGKAKKKNEPDMDAPVNKKVQVTNKSWPIPSALSLSKNRDVPVFKFGESKPKIMQGSNHPGYAAHSRKSHSKTPTFHYWLNPFIWDTKWNGSGWEVGKLTSKERPSRIAEGKNYGGSFWYPWAEDKTFLNPTYSSNTEENYLKMMNDPQFFPWQHWPTVYKKPQPPIWKSGNGFVSAEIPYAFNASWDNLVSKFRINAFGQNNIPIPGNIKSSLSMMDVGIIMNFQQCGIVNRYTVGDAKKPPAPAASGTEQHLMMVEELVGNWVLGERGKDSMIGQFLPSSKSANLNWAHEPHWCGIFSFFISKKSGHSFASPIQVSGYERNRLRAGLPLNRPRLEEEPDAEWDELEWISTAYAVDGGNLNGYATHTPWLIAMAKHPDNPEHLWDADYINTYKNQINQIWFVENIHYIKDGKNGKMTEWGKRLIMGAIDQNIIDWPAAFATTYGHVEVCVGLDLDGTVYLFGGNSGGELSRDGVPGNKMGFWAKHIGTFAPGIKAKNPWTGEGYDGGGHLCLSRMTGGNNSRYHAGISAPWNNSPILETYKNYVTKNPDPKFPVYKTYLDRILAINTIDIGLGLEVSTDLLY